MLKYLFILLIIIITINYFFNHQNIEGLETTTSIGSGETNEEKCESNCPTSTEIIGTTVNNLMSSVNTLNDKYDELSKEFGLIQEELKNNTERIDYIYTEYENANDKLSSSMEGVDLSSLIQ
jgi:peptidoglycan hydrolase CwlO-like protein